MEVESHSACGTLPRPPSVTNARYSFPSREKATSGAKHLASSPFGAGIAVCAQVLPASEETCSAQEKKGVSMRLVTARLAGRAGLRTSVGELCALMSPDMRAERFTGASGPATRTVGRSSNESETTSATAPRITSQAPRTPDSNEPRRPGRAGGLVAAGSGDSPDGASGEPP